jgi:hypothetical protein
MNSSLSPEQQKAASKVLPSDKTAQIRVDRNWWRLLSLVLAVTVIVLAFITQGANERAGTRDVVWVKMFPNGTWDVSTADAFGQRDYFQTTVDGLLAEFAKLRYAVIPETVRSDYGKTLLFLSNDLATEFTAINGYDAANKAAQFSASPATPRVSIKVGTIDHYDRITGKLRSGVSTPVYRTNIYLKRTTKSAEGSPRGEPENLTLSVRWTALSEEDIEKKDELFLRANPIGLTILEYELFEEIK